MRTMAIVAGVLAALTTAARAGKPSAAAAKKTAQAWMGAMGIDRDADASEPAALALTASPFWSIATEDASDGEKCKETTATDAASIGAALACLREHVQSDGKLKSWSKKVAKENGVTYVFKKKLAALAKTATLVELEAECAGTFNQVVFAVVQGDDGTAKVAAVLSLSGLCGE
jgi:hypothetical protein